MTKLLQMKFTNIVLNSLNHNIKFGNTQAVTISGKTPT
jgi:hypothetical protein